MSAIARGREQVRRDFEESALQRPFRVRPSSASPLNLVAFTATQAGSLLNRRFGKYGFNWLHRLTGTTLVSQTLAATWRDGMLLFPALDTYSCAMFLEKQYEPELFSFFRVVRDEPYSFVDGGANLGFWSVQISGERFGSHPTVAIEASFATFMWLQRNRIVNQCRFMGLHAAVHRVSGEILMFDESAEHAARRVTTKGGSAVVSVAVDDVVDRFLPDASTLIIKLDVEGAEPNALAGSSRSRDDRDCVFIVEDHGSDKNHSTAAACFAEGLDLWRLNEFATATPMPDLAAVARVKTRSEVGYNFVACAPNGRLARRIGLTRAAARSGETVQLQPPSAKP